MLLTIFLLQFLSPIAGEAAPFDPAHSHATVKRPEGASISNTPFHTEPRAENIFPVQQVVTVLKSRDQHQLTANFTSDISLGMHACFDGHYCLLKRVPSNNLQSRLMLFPKHYFW